MEETLHKERDLINTTLHALDALVVVLNRDGNMVRFNHACETLSGYAEDEVLGRSFSEFLLPEERNSVMAVFQDLLSGRSSKGYCNHWITRNGAPKLIEWSSSTVSDSDGHVTHIIATGIDRSRYQKIEPFPEG
jgi:PAS domain S-box-containing protein